MIVVFLLVLSPGASAAGERFSAAVRWVDDGDTVVLNDGRRVRYIGINAPEIAHEERPAEPFGYKARKFNRQLVLKKKVILELDHEHFDRYGRLLAYVFLSAGTMVNAEMVARGLAFFYPRRPNLRFDALLLQRQREAMADRRGIWGPWRKKKGVYWGNRRSRRFHLPTCPFAGKIRRENRVVFTSKWDAFHAGYAPAKKCIRQFWSYP